MGRGSILLAVLLLAACGGSTQPSAATFEALQTAAPTPTPTLAPVAPTTRPTPTPTIGTSEAALYLIRTQGYDYVALPAQTEATLMGAFNDPRLRGLVSSVVARSVTLNGDSSGLSVLVMALTPSVAALPEAQAELNSALIGGSAGTIEQKITLAGRSASFFSKATSPTLDLTWLHRVYYVDVAGRDRQAIEKFGAALINANVQAAASPTATATPRPTAVPTPVATPTPTAAPPATSQRVAIVVRPIDARAPVITATVTGGTPSTTATCVISVELFQSTPDITVEFNSDGAGGCGYNLSRNAALVQGKLATVVITKDGAEIGRTSVRIPTP